MTSQRFLSSLFSFRLSFRHFIPFSAPMDEHGETPGANPEILASLSAREQDPLIFCLLTEETGYLFVLSLFRFS